MTQGSWDIAEGIVDMWVAQGLDEAFAARWNDASLLARYSPLVDNEALEGQPKPYCVMELGEAQSQDTHSAAGSNLGVLASVPFQFRIHAATKPQAVEMAKLVADVFDNARFAAGETCVIGMARLADFSARETNGWVWVLRYGIIQDAEQAVNN